MCFQFTCFSEMPSCQIARPDPSTNTNVTTKPQPPSKTGMNARFRGFQPFSVYPHHFCPLFSTTATPHNTEIEPLDHFWRFWYLRWLSWPTSAQEGSGIEGEWVCVTHFPNKVRVFSRTSIIYPLIIVMLPTDFLTWHFSVLGRNKSPPHDEKAPCSLPRRNRLDPPLLELDTARRFLRVVFFLILARRRGFYLPVEWFFPFLTQWEGGSLPIVLFLYFSDVHL
jgi:hypothetical protein